LDIARTYNGDIKKDDKYRVATTCGVFSVSNVKTFLIGFILVAAGGTLFGFMLADESWMVADYHPENLDVTNGQEEVLEDQLMMIYKDESTIRLERGIYGWEDVAEGEYCWVNDVVVDEDDCNTINFENSYSYGDKDEKNSILKECEVFIEDADGLGLSEDPCDIIAAGDTTHWIFLGGIILVSLAIILAFIAIPGYIPGWIISLLMVLAVLTIAIGAVVWLVMYPEVNDDIENPDEHFSPSYGFYLTLASTPLLFLGGIAWGGMDAYALGNDDYDEDEEEWRDAMETSDVGDANWRQQQNRPTMIPDTRELQQQQYQQEMQQYQYQDQGYHNQQSYAQPQAQRQVPSSPSPTSLPPFGGSPSAPPNAGPPQAAVGPPRSGPSGPSGPSGMGGPPRSGPPAGPSMSPKPKGPPRSESSSSPRVRKAIAPIPNPKQAVPAQPVAPVAPVAAAPVVPVAHQPVAAVQPAPVAPVAAAPVAPVAYQPVAAVQPAPVAPVAPVAHQPVAAQPTAPVAAVQPAPVAAAPVAPVAYQPVAAVQPAPVAPVAAAPVAPVAYQPAAAQPVAPVAPVAAAPVAYQPAAVVQPAPILPVVAAPVAVAQPAASLTGYIAPVMPTAPQQSAVPLMSQSGTVRADGWEILEWPQGSGKWFWKDRNSGRWTLWK
jgi:hypothetical protein